MRLHCYLLYKLTFYEVSIVHCFGFFSPKIQENKVIVRIYISVLLILSGPKQNKKNCQHFLGHGNKGKDILEKVPETQSLKMCLFCTYIWVLLENHFNVETVIISSIYFELLTTLKLGIAITHLDLLRSKSFFSWGPIIFEY